MSLYFRNLSITEKRVEEDYYSEKLKKSIKYKKPKVTTKVLYENKWVGNIGDLYDKIKFITEEHGSHLYGKGHTLTIKVEPEIDY
tara:strand:+ start:365 stop:619 length:255 start_codon:yes stop_codon:yes gene_type:complete